MMTAVMTDAEAWRNAMVLCLEYLPWKHIIMISDSAVWQTQSWQLCCLSPGNSADVITGCSSHFLPHHRHICTTARKYSSWQAHVWAPQPWLVCCLNQRTLVSTKTKVCEQSQPGVCEKTSHNNSNIFNEGNERGNGNFKKLKNMANTFRL